MNAGQPPPGRRGVEGLQRRVDVAHHGVQLAEHPPVQQRPLGQPAPIRRASSRAAFAYSTKNDAVFQ